MRKICSNAIWSSYIQKQSKSPKPYQSDLINDLIGFFTPSNHCAVFHTVPLLMNHDVSLTFLIMAIILIFEWNSKDCLNFCGTLPLKKRLGKCSWGFETTFSTSRKGRCISRLFGHERSQLWIHIFQTHIGPFLF